jgi:sortase (surface protein transpeptidase)
LLSACGQAIAVSPTKPVALSTVAGRQHAVTVSLPTPNHQLIDKPILDDLAATAQPASAPQAVPTVIPSPARQAIPQHEPARLVINDIALDRPLLPVGLDDAIPIVPKHDAGWFTHSAMPGQGENIVLWGHALRFRDEPNVPAPFARLNQLKLGARVVLYDDLGKAYTYRITHQIWVTPDQVRYILPTGKERVTMVSCIGDQVIGSDGAVVNMTQRLITIAEPQT